MKQYEEAVNCYDQSLKIKSDYQSALKNRDYALIKLKEQQKPQANSFLLGRLSYAWIIIFILLIFYFSFSYSNFFFNEHQDENIEQYDQQKYVYLDCNQIDLNYFFELFCIQNDFNIECRNNPKEFYKFFCEAQHLERKGKYYQSLRKLNQAMIINSKDLILLGTLGKTLIQVNDYDKALNIFEQGINLYQHTIDFFIHKFEVLLSLNRFEAAMKFSNETIQLFPNNFIPYHLFGMELYKVKHYHEAIKMFDQSILLKSDYCENYLEIGNQLI